MRRTERFGVQISNSTGHEVDETDRNKSVPRYTLAKELLVGQMKQAKTIKRYVLVRRR